MRERQTLGLWMAALFAAFVTQLGSGPSALAAEPPNVCGVAEVVDELLCTDVPPSDLGEPGQPGEPSAAASEGSDASGERVGGRAAEAESLDRTREVSLKRDLRFDPRRLAVTFDPGTSDAVARAVLARAGAEIESVVPAVRAYVVRAEPEQRAEILAALRSSPRVANAGREIVAGAVDTVPNDRLWSYQSGLRLAAFPRAWDVARGSSSVVVAVVDTGVDPTHPDLTGALVAGYDFVNGDADPRDDEGHGTAVAGLIASRTNNGEGVAGACWACLIMPVKVLDATGSGGTTRVAAGIVWAADRGAQVINLSLGTPATTSALSDAVAYAARKGSIVVAAAGNEGTTSPFYPAAEPLVLSIAATDLEDHLYSWSNRGAWVRMAAPGCNVAPVPGGYGSFCGTSSAAPVVAGLAALARAFRPSAPNVEVERAIEETAARLQTGVESGRIDAAGTLGRLTGGAQPRVDAPLRTTVTVSATIGAGQTASYRRTVGAGLVSGTLTFPRESRLTFSLTGPNGAVATSSGLSPLHLERTLTAGSIRVTASGALRKTAVVLTLSHAAAAVQRVSLPPLPAVPPLDGRTVGASIGRPALGPEGSVGIAAIGLDGAETSEAPIVAEINAVRRRFRLPPLRVSPLLARAADAHAASMGLRGYFAHEWADGTPFGRWIVRYYPALPGRACITGENLIWASPALDAKRAVKAWLASPPHRRNLLDPRWREIGVGVVGAQGAIGVYGGHDVQIGVAEFGRR